MCIFHTDPRISNAFGSYKYPIKRVTNTAFDQPMVELRDACYKSWNNPYFASGAFTA